MDFLPPPPTSSSTTAAAITQPQYQSTQSDQSISKHGASISSSVPTAEAQQQEALPMLSLIASAIVNMDTRLRSIEDSLATLAARTSQVGS